MNQIIFIPHSQEANLRRFLDNHGAGLDGLFRSFHGDPDFSASGNILRVVEVPVQERRQALNDVLDETVTTLLDYVGETFPVPDEVRGQDLDAALQWYAARLYDLRQF